MWELWEGSTTTRLLPTALSLASRFRSHNCAQAPPGQERRSHQKDRGFSPPAGSATSCWGCGQQGQDAADAGCTAGQRYLEDLDLAAGRVQVLRVLPVLVLLEGVNLHPKGHPLLPAVLPHGELRADAVNLGGGTAPCCQCREKGPRQSSQSTRVGKELRGRSSRGGAAFFQLFQRVWQAPGCEEQPPARRGRELSCTSLCAPQPVRSGQRGWDVARRCLRQPGRFAKAGWRAHHPHQRGLNHHTNGTTRRWPAELVCCQPTSCCPLALLVVEARQFQFAASATAASGCYFRALSQKPSLFFP